MKTYTPNLWNRYYVNLKVDESFQRKTLNLILLSYKNKFIVVVPSVFFRIHSRFEFGTTSSSSGTATASLKTFPFALSLHLEKLKYQFESLFH